MVAGCHLVAMMVMSNLAKYGQSIRYVGGRPIFWVRVQAGKYQSDDGVTWL
jgi:hypothetical protein